MKYCSFMGCWEKVHGKGLCVGHYRQSTRGDGQLRILREKTSTAEARDTRVYTPADIDRQWRNRLLRKDI